MGRVVVFCNLCRVGLCCCISEFRCQGGSLLAHSLVLLLHPLPLNPSTTINRPPECTVCFRKCTRRHLYTFVAFAPLNFGQHSFLLLIASPLPPASTSIFLLRATAIPYLHCTYCAVICESLVSLLYGLRLCVPLLLVSMHL